MNPRRTGQADSAMPIVLLAAFVAAFVWSIIHPAKIGEWAAEALPALIGIAVLVFTYRRFRFTGLTYTFVAIGGILMLIGGHYTYAEVPLFNVIKDMLHLHRNDYDRFGHVVQGVVPFLMLRELLVCGKVVSLQKRAWLNFLAIAFTLAVSATYELAEFAGAKLVGGSAEDFLGTQGDPWDSQWDMLSALIGSVLAFLFFSRLHDKLLAQRQSLASKG